MDITPKLVKSLRERTNAGMMDCKKALVECQGDVEKAVDWLRQKGLVSAHKRAGRAAREGLVQTAQSKDSKKGAIVELNSETDFVAKMNSFKDIAAALTEYLVDEAKLPKDLDELLTREPSFNKAYKGKTFGDIITATMSATGEHVKLRRFKVLEADDTSMVHSYVHAGGRLAVLLKLSVEKFGPEALELAHNLAMHIAAANPLVIKVSDLPQSLLDKETAIYQAKAADEAEARIQKTPPDKKPPDKKMLIKKIVEGQVKKFHTEVVLLEQPYVKDPGKTVAELLHVCEPEVGKSKIEAFVRYLVGEELDGEIKPN
ncbi:MAG: translation elongation factor Ts [Deltaproteobacteria bacterium]|jgi:elongation factor Ts|nr:translation elongation factor Ts [Deltaproteobacteria bacterium]